MSERNVQLHRLLIEAYNGRDIEAFISYCDPQIEFHALFAAAGGALYRGHDGLRMWHRDLEDIWGDEIRLEPDAYFDLGEHTIASFGVHARGRLSGAEVEMTAAQLVRWREGLIVYLKVYALRQDALSALGVSEDALEPIEP